MSTGLKIKLKLFGAPVVPANGQSSDAPPAQPLGAPPHKKHGRKRRHNDTEAAAQPSGEVAQPQGVPPPVGGWDAATGGLQSHAGASAEKPKKKRKKDKHREHRAEASEGQPQPSDSHAPLPKIRFRTSGAALLQQPAQPSGSGGWDGQLAAAAAAAGGQSLKEPASWSQQYGSYPIGGYAAAGTAAPAETKPKKPKKRPPKAGGAARAAPPWSPDSPRPEKRRKKKRVKQQEGYAAAAPDALRGSALLSGPPAKREPRPSLKLKLGNQQAAAAPSAEASVDIKAEPESAVDALAAQLVQPAGQPVREPQPPDILRIIDKVQKKDAFEIFKEPVTDAVAPGYSAAIKRPMDFTTMRARHAAGAYSTWDALSEDMRTMFNNAMSFNTPDTLYHKQARTLLGVADKLIGLASQGVTDFRGRTAGIVRQANAQLAAEAKQERDQARAAGRASKANVRASKLAERASASGVSLAGTEAGTEPQKAAPRMGRPPGRQPAIMAPPPEVDETVKLTYPVKCREPSQSALRGLAAGANAEGVPFGRQALVPLAGAASSTTYIAHLTAFIAGLKGSVAQHAKAYIKQYLSPTSATAARPLQAVAQPQPVATVATVQPPASTLPPSLATLPTMLPRPVAALPSSVPTVLPVAATSAPALNPPSSAAPAAAGWNAAAVPAQPAPLTTGSLLAAAASLSAPSSSAPLPAAPAAAAP